MKLRLLFALIIAAAFVGCSTTNSGSWNSSDSKAAMKDPMKIWQEAATPGKSHTNLKPLVGKWKTKVTWWMDPDSAPEVTSGKATRTWVLGSRFVEENYTGKSMGQPFSGRGLYGYDNVGKRYVSTWTDTMTTGIMKSTGSYNMSANTLSWNGQYQDPITGQLRNTRSTTRIIDNNKHIFEMYDTDPEGREYRALEIIYTRTNS